MIKQIKYYALILAMGAASTINAQTITYTTINQENKKDYIERWGISEDEFNRYVQVMETEGRFRYPNLTPLEVLGITAENDALKQYYARKAAEDEREAVKAQIHFALLTTAYKEELSAKEKKEAEAKKLEEIEYEDIRKEVEQFFLEMEKEKQKKQ